MTKREALQNLMAPDLYERFKFAHIAAMRILVRSENIIRTKAFVPISLESCGDLRHVTEVGEK